MGLLDVLKLKPKTPVGVAAVTGSDAGAGAAAVAGVSTGKVAKAGAAEVVAYQVARGEVQVLVIGLNGHAQAGKITGLIGQATARLGLADGHAAKAEFVEAHRLLAEARAICVAAKKRADDWAAYAKKRGTVNAQIRSIVGFAGPADIATLDAIVASADAFVALSPPDFVNGIATLDSIDSVMRPARRTELDDVKAMLVKAEAMDAKAKAFFSPQIANAKGLLAQSEKAFTDGEWSLCIMTKNAASDVLGPTIRAGERRTRFDTQRSATVASLAAVKALPELKERAVEIEASVIQADALAGSKSMQIEDAIKLLQTADARCKTWLPIAPTIRSYQSGLAAAQKELAALDAHPGKDKIVEAREAARKLLQTAATTATIAPGGNDPARGWNTALTGVTRARADLAEAKKLVDALGPALAAEAAAANPGDPAAMKKALAALQADAALAAKAPFAAEAAAELKRFKADADKANAALTKNDAKAAGKALAEAAKALAEAKAIQVEHGQFAATLADVEAKLKTLQGLPGAAAIKGKIDAVVKAIAEAKAKDKAHAGADAMAALRRAVDAVTAAEQANRDRIDYDKAATATAAVVGALADANVKAALTKSIEGAKNLAIAFRFAEANKALKQVELRADEARLKATIKANPADPNIAAIAAKMAGAGGAKEVDDLLQTMSDPAVIGALAKGRFGMDFKIDAGANAAQEAKSLKAMCKAFAKVSKDMVKNTSIKGVSHVDAIRDPGGAYDPMTALISMKGRPKEADLEQKFGSKLKTPIAPGVFVDQLGKVDPECKPQNEDAVDFLGFAAYHEVAHGIDDELTFMARKGDKEPYGGWISYGSSVNPIADIVGPHFKFYTTPEQKQYVLDKLLSRPTTPPPVPALPGDWAKAKADFDRWHALATSADVYRREADCVKLTVGTRIYHEAYPRNWVSYSAAARARGLTGYQFRAPGEWFSELYAGYKSGKLGSKHPALEWLKDL